jgi:D-sedoheptulose 7-phosphate isomerase
VLPAIAKGHAVQTNPDLQFVGEWLSQSAAATAAFAADDTAAAALIAIADAIARALRQGGKLLLAGNGGSAADAQHIAGEFVCRMNYDRPPMAAVALHADTSSLTATGNDYGFEFIFERQVLALGRAGDVLLAISTSGSSPNILRALQAARSRGMATIGFTGKEGGVMAAYCDWLLRAPASVTPLVQQLHIVAAHIVCSLVERALYPRAEA